MNKLDEIRSALSESYKDHKLDPQEKSELLTVFKSLNPDQRKFARNHAFTVVRECVDEVDALSALKWLEKIMKTIDLSRAAPTNNSVHFSPGADCRDVILDNMKRCTRALDICVFTISDNLIRDEIKKCHQRGVKVRIISDDDKANDLGSDIDELFHGGLSVRKDRTRHHMHHKFAIFDNKVVLTGSFNWTRSATEYNHENILETNSEKVIAQYSEEFDRLWDEFS